MVLLLVILGLVYIDILVAVGVYKYTKTNT